jgi:hypothetical protein
LTTESAHPVYVQLSEVEGERKKKYRDFIKAMLKGKDAMRGRDERESSVW